MSTLKGKVKWFNGTKGYGFIEREDKEKDVFVHSSAVREAGLKFLNEGDELTFEVENGGKRSFRSKIAENILNLIAQSQIIGALTLEILYCPVNSFAKIQTSDKTNPMFSKKTVSALRTFSQSAC